MSEKTESLSSIFNPKSVAVVGASTNPQKLGAVILSNVIDCGFEGAIYPVNPKDNNIQGLKAYKSVKDIPGELDVACIVIPRDYVDGVIDECIEKDVKGIIIISAGFSEIGEEGEAIENKIADKCKKAGIRLIGPNCLGILNPSANLNVSFAASHARKGNIAFLSQSGAFCTAMLDLSLEKNLGFHNFVSVGNKADVSENDLINYWKEDDDVNVIGAYIEEIGTGLEFMELAHDLDKPLVVLKPGESNEAKEAISSHTGSLAGSSEAVNAALEKSGVVHVKTISEMFNSMMGFSWAPLPKGNNVAVVTNAGGPGIIATDAVVEAGLNMANLSEDSVNSMKEVLPPTSNFHNPVDVIGDAGADRYRCALENLRDDDNVDSILVILTPQIVTEIEQTAKTIMNIAKTTDKPIFAAFLGDHFVNAGLRIFYDFKIPAFQDIHTAVKTLHNMTRYAEFKDNKVSLQSYKEISKDGKYHKEVEQVLQKAKKSDETAIAISEKLASKIADEFNLPVPKQAVASNLLELKAFAKDKYPVALKATTEDLAHKTDKKAVFLDIKDEDALEEAFKQLESVLTESGVEVPKYLIQEFIAEYEPLFVGANRDGTEKVYETGKGFGHLLALGYGGIYAEIFNDIRLVLAPSSKDQIREKLDDTAAWKIMSGARGKQALATEPALDFILNVQEMLITYPQIKSVDFNPVLVTKNRAVAVDIKIFVG